MRRGTALVLTAALALAGGSASALETNIRAYVCQKLDDFTATIKVVSVNQRELAKINKDAGLIYKFKEVRLSYKEPNKVRMEGSLEGTRAVYIINGATQYVSIPKIRLNTRRDYEDEPGKRKSLMDVGLVSDYYLTYTDAKFLREGTVDGTPVAVFEMRFKDKDNTSRQVVYIDPKTRVVRKREAYSQEGKLQAIYWYKDVQEVRPGIWFPTRIEVQNVDRVIAGVTEYTDIKVNVGLPDGIFKL